MDNNVQNLLSKNFAKQLKNYVMNLRLQSKVSANLNSPTKKLY